MKFGYEVTLLPVERTGVRGGTATMWVASAERAAQIVTDMPSHRSYRAVPWDEVPEAIRQSLERC